MMKVNTGNQMTVNAHSTAFVCVHEFTRAPTQIRLNFILFERFINFSFFSTSSFFISIWIVIKTRAINFQSYSKATQMTTSAANWLRSRLIRSKNEWKEGISWTLWRNKWIQINSIVARCWRKMSKNEKLNFFFRSATNLKFHNQRKCTHGIFEEIFFSSRFPNGKSTSLIDWYGDCDCKS